MIAVPTTRLCNSFISFDVWSAAVISRSIAYTFKLCIGSNGYNSGSAVNFRRGRKGWKGTGVDAVVA